MQNLFLLIFVCFNISQSQASSITHKSLFLTFFFPHKSSFKNCVEKGISSTVFAFVTINFITQKSMDMESKSSLSSYENPEVEKQESMRFAKSLQELRGLRSQLHTAADYCEAAFLKGKEKRRVLENTKEYICRAVVTVVDHLGNVSANLECLISQTDAFSEAEIRINCLKQRLLSCELYAHKLALTKVRWSENLPRFHSRYLSSLTEKSSSGKLRESGSEVPLKIEDLLVLETQEDLPLFMYTQKPCPMKNSKSNTATIKEHANLALVEPVRDKLPVLTNIPNPTFHFQDTQKIGRHRKPLNGSDILWLIRRRKR